MRHRIIIYKNEDNCNLLNVFVYEDNKLVEIYEENIDDKRLEGNVYLGEVKDIATGIQSAFVDIGQQKKAIIHIKDLISKESEKTGNENIDLSKYNINNYVKRGENIIVQIKRDNSNSEKGPKITHDIKLIGKHIVLMPYSKFITVSKKIENNFERKRLIDITNDELKKHNQNFGAIIRTSAENVNEDIINFDIEELLERWNLIQKLARNNTGPKLLYDNQGIIGKLMCDFCEEDLEVITNSKDLLKELKSKYTNRIIKYDANILNKDSKEFVEKEKRKIWLKCGGYITIDVTEAMNTIDVNSGKYEGTQELEKNLFQVNKEAAEEIARQMRLKDLGGIIVVDFIDMKEAEDRKNVKEIMQEAVKLDRTKVQVMDFTKLGLLEITRKPIFGK